MGSSSSTMGRPHTSSGTRVLSPSQQLIPHQAHQAPHQAPHQAQPMDSLYPSLEGVEPRRHSMAASYHYPNAGYPPQQVVHPQVRTENPSAPLPLGFKEVYFNNPPPDGADQDTSRDLTLSRVFAADEFLGRMAETDEKIKLMSSVREEDKSSVYEKLMQHLGLRGHLQDELLRIQQMLAADDPELRCLDGLEDYCPAAVSTLKQLNEKAKQIQSGEAPTEQLGKQIGMDLTPLEPELIDTMIGEEEAVETRTSGGPSTAVGGTQTEIVERKEESVKQDLKEKHDEDSFNVLKAKEVREEQHVASNFAQRITKANKNLSQDEINELLNQHAISMQALRKKQEVERKYLTDKLEAKKRERMLKRHQLDDRTDSGLPITSTQAPQDNTVYKMPGYVVQLSNNKSPQSSMNRLDSRNTHNLRKGSMPNVPVGKATIITSQTARTSEQLNVKGRTGSASSRGSATKKGKGEPLDSDDDLEDLITSVNDQDNYSSDDFEDDSEEDEEKETLRATLQDDLWSHRNQMTSEDFKALIGAYRNQEDERRKVRNAEKDRHKQGLLSKLAEQKRAQKEQSNSRPNSARKTAESQDDDAELTADQVEVIKDSDEYFSKEISKRIRSMSDEEFEELLRRHLSDVEALRRMRNADRDRLDAKLRERLRNAERGNLDDDEDEDPELQKLKSDFTNRLCNKRRYLDEEDLQALLQQYHKDRTALVQARKGDRDRMDEKLKQKLQEKSRKKKEETKRTKGKNEATMDTGFFEKLQALQAGGSLNKEQFNALLQEYLDQAGSKKRNRKQRQEEMEEERKQVHRTASALVRESHDQRKQIHMVRQREKAAMDEKLKKKLQMAAPKKQIIQMKRQLLQMAHRYLQTAIDLYSPIEEPT